MRVLAYNDSRKSRVAHKVLWTLFQSTTQPTLIALLLRAEHLKSIFKKLCLYTSAFRLRRSELHLIGATTPPKQNSV